MCNLYIYWAMGACVAKYSLKCAYSYLRNRQKFGLEALPTRVVKKNSTSIVNKNPSLFDRDIMSKISVSMRVQCIHITASVFQINFLPGVYIHRGAFQCYATPTGGNNSRMVRHFVPERNIFVFSSASCGVDILMTL